MRAGITLSALTSSWLPFLVHAIAQLKRGGRLAMVLPFELTHAWMLALAVALFLSCSTFPAVGQDNAVDSLKALRARADHGDAEAQVIIGVLYAKGQGVAQDYAEALRWFRKAADQGLAEAQFNLGFMYDKGRGLPAPSRSPRAPTTRTTCPPSIALKPKSRVPTPPTTLARQVAVFTYVSTYIQRIKYNRTVRGPYTPAEQRIMGAYDVAKYQIMQDYEKSHTPAETQAFQRSRASTNSTGTSRRTGGND